MKQIIQGQRMSIFLTEGDHYHHKPLYVEIVSRAHKEGLSGATVLKGFDGFGTKHQIHTTRFLDLDRELPVVVIIIDTKEKILQFQKTVDSLMTEGIITIEDVEVVHYSK